MPGKDVPEAGYGKDPTGCDDMRRTRSGPSAAQETALSQAFGMFAATTT